MSKTKAPQIISHIDPKHQPEVMLNAILSIQAHTMTMAGVMMNLQALIMEPKDKPASLVRDFYIQDFHNNVKLMQEMYLKFGKIDSI